MCFISHLNLVCVKKAVLSSKRRQSILPQCAGVVDVHLIHICDEKKHKYAPLTAGDIKSFLYSSTSSYHIVKNGMHSIRLQFDIYYGKDKNRKKPSFIFGHFIIWRKAYEESNERFGNALFLPSFLQKPGRKREKKKMKMKKMKEMNLSGNSLNKTCK